MTAREHALPTVVVTGGAGFIGSALVRRLVASDAYRVVVVDKLTYAGNLDSLRDVANSPNFTFVRADICDAPAVSAVLDAHRPRAIIHLAAESHVDRSIDGPAAFLETNVVGTYVLLEAALAYWRATGRDPDFRFLHVSTDEVYGSLGDTGYFTEETPYAPRSPYSATKAASDHLVAAWGHTYGLPVVTTNCSNNYGPYQFPEKLIPLTILSALAGRELPVYGAGANVRDWLHVDDHVAGLQLALERGLVGESYNIGGRSERRNIDVVRTICGILDELAPRDDGSPHASRITFVTDRPGHDQRYAIDPSKVEHELGWRPARDFETGLRETITWYLTNRDWCDRVQSGAYQGERLGLAAV